MKQFRLSIITLAIFSSLLLNGCDAEKIVVTREEIAIIPKPQSFQLNDGSFLLDKNTTLYSEPEFAVAEDFLRAYLTYGAGISLPSASHIEADILISLDTTLPAEGYTLEISGDKILLKASDAGGAFYGVQILRQLLPVQLEKQTAKIQRAIQIPQLNITDAPKFAYRGMHFDVSRHFFPKEFIKKYIESLALLKMNYFHWHLTDDQGWRIEIKKYPKLTSHAAFREETLIGHYNATPQEFDEKRYGGFYKQEEIAEIVAFASKYNVTIIPEIEMPGHAQAAISAYPELGCTGESVPVATKWGVFEEIFCPKEETFTFLKDVLTEVMVLFPGEYIHIGGDEAPKTRWENCEHCQKLIKDNNLKDEQGLQSYFIKEIEAFVNSKGKKIIGWDEILEGGLAPNATVMSWRGLDGGIAAAKEKHKVIMTPTSHAYFDYYQADNADEPLAIGGFLPLKKVYGFNPIPKELSEEEAQFIWGAQGNIWTEYIQTEEQVDYMAFPRMLAMSEVVWSGTSENLEKAYPEFLSRVEPFLERLKAMKVNYANHLYEIDGRVRKEKGAIYFNLSTPTEGKEIKYSINHSEIQTYNGAFAITIDSEITANVYKNGEKVGRDFREEIKFHKGLSATIILNVPPHPAYSSGGKEALLNGISGSDSRYGDKEWLGFWGDDLEITIDFEKETEINSVSLRFYNANGQWIYAPEKIDLLVIQVEGHLLPSTALFQKTDNSNIVDVIFELSEKEKIFSKQIKLTIPSFGTIPEGKQGAGNKAWTFIDEIIIE
ncbi:hexosaminidase [Ulvibacter sp. MAR_2010_11]|uniref:beta-N-acetylhexosaminidase n=1 Tax=Ulvibacter sp. MAR_2010_11 TaxID=1250229 RepID=UPI000C2BCB3F|nr:beta-N-acetylhexosaminidase [Ulvibacter sp. MAR_2010_11]PKA83021.1 hexosaminidase [Ulvibacter sp. MAR_2010_11]